MWLSGSKGNISLMPWKLQPGFAMSLANLEGKENSGAMLIL
jgi:hypothetical protein